MMATTHVFAALAAITPVAIVVPEFATPLAVGAILGGLAPDFDLLFEHRRTFHFPVAGVPVAVGGITLAGLAPTAVTVAFAAFTIGAWLHAVSDAAGGGPEMDPWNDPSNRAVYDHVRGQWLRPRRWIRYDGAPEDTAIAIALSFPVLVVFDGWISAVVAAGIVVSLGYTLVRRRLVGWLPDWLE